MTIVVYRRRGVTTLAAFAVVAGGAAGTGATGGQRDSSTMFRVSGS